MGRFLEEINFMSTRVEWWVCGSNGEGGEAVTKFVTKDHKAGKNEKES